MCGIVGFLNLDGAPADAVILGPMVAAIAHRGPDGEGRMTDGPLALGHRRLAVLDVSPAGAQPMTSSDGEFTLSYNGEVYNFPQLRTELEDLGYVFRSATDTEVVLYAWMAWGESALDRFNGMFAFALWDHRERQLILARDRHGIKPLYYHNNGRVMCFGSEIKALLAHPHVSATLDLQGLREYMTFQNFFTDRTLFKNVSMLPAGCLLRVGHDGSTSMRRYWDYRFADSLTLSPSECAEEFHHRFKRAIRRHVISDVPVGCYLSGGMDSCSIAALARRECPDLRTFTIGFDIESASGLELGCDERDAARMVAQWLRTRHQDRELCSGDMERVMKRLVYHLEEPRVGQSYPNFHAAQLARTQATVVLAGTGGDELFGGYPWRYYRAAASSHFDAYVDNYYGFWQRMLTDDQIRQLFSPIWSDVATVDTRQIMRDVFVNHQNDLRTPEDYINHSFYFEAKTFLHGLLVVEDKLSMAHGLESRLPFLDNEVVDFAQNLPVAMKLNNLGTAVQQDENETGNKTRQYYRRTRDGKLLLRDAMRRYLPPEITEAAKTGFSAPDASWFRGDSIDYVREKLLSPQARIVDLFDPTTLHGLVADHLEGRVNRRLLIWSFLCIEEWLGIFLGGETVS